MLRAGVQIAANLVVARILGPEHYGQAAVVLGLSVVLELVRSGGFASVVLRSGDQPVAVLAALHRMSALAGLALGLVVASVGIAFLTLAPEDPYGVLLLTIAVAFPISGTAAVPIATMVQRSEMGRVVAVESTAAVVGAVIAVALAVAGAGPLAVIAQVVVMWIIVGVGITMLRRVPWVPRDDVAPWSTVRPMVGLAVDVSLVQVISMVSRTGDRVLAIALFGPAASGFWTQANQLVSMPLDQVGAAVQRIAVPALAAAGSAKLLDRSRQFVAATTLLVWPVLALLGVLAEDVVGLLFGPTWRSTADLVPFIAVAGAAQALGCVPVWFFVSSGRVRAQVRWVLVAQPVTVLALVVGSVWGVRGMAIGSAAAAVSLVLPSFAVALRGSGLSTWRVVSAAGPAALVASVAGGSAWLAQSVAPTDAFSAVLVPAVSGLLTGCLAAVAFPSSRGWLRTRSRLRTPESEAAATR
ncbi:oligosaccharide flippase family protein [Curtobacterium sp. TC1]|nr:oligosaccharide flippase family protein [Curtobacterium sp. TC1]